MFSLDSKRRFFWLVISIIINSAANALTVSTNMGSAVWTASAVNLSHLVMHTSDPAIANQSLGLVLVGYGIAVAFLAMLLSWRIDLWRLFRNILFIVPFSYLIQWIVPFWSNTLGISHLHASFSHPWELALLVFLDMIGLFGIAVAVSLYQRANLIMHPNDDLSYIIRFKYLKGLAATAQWISYIPPILITIMCVLLNHYIWAVNFGTVWAFLTQGYVQGWADHHVVPTFKHHFSYHSK
ncbi:hypothetical protein [Pediococcus claussenii]|uniref:Membrane protein n=1 Tax=Pediococcus claussenii (strain ATCC BAA-344 / DSM 14800 / JCM 18046 / KCTC 3811 / LMG 21948 / P06) TaxID=701521 RepID=G8PBE7_PEDCP|nr:hypothetical protein [Pediococcus claussenii]AEV95936.1 putative membrane protein [Pediococcus claussenii ATCC BAA-344]ANZ69426.1 hypothetical protein AYR57_03485 [Pediococcus claussenii]ANZ71246.1 hypothetical protein AYR58_03500 [Pediococcus claussenii]KRN20540.1 hypothetical protein IV79_GL000598 [Pediococcus claussenii]